MFRSITVLLPWRLVQHYFKVFAHTSKRYLSAIFETHDVSSIHVLSESVSTIFIYFHGEQFFLIAVYFIKSQNGLDTT